MRTDAPARPRTAAALCAAAVAVTVAVAHTGAAWAGPSGVEGAKAALVDGDRSFQLGRFEQAIEAYERAYSMDPQPAFLFNIALAHRRPYQIDGKIEHLLRARELYRNYLKLDPATPRRAGVAKMLGELDAQIEAARRNQAPPVAPPPVTSPPLAPVPPVALAPKKNETAPTPALITTPSPAGGEPRASSGKRWLIVGGVAVALAIGIAAVVIATRGSAFDGPGVDLTGR